MDRVLVVGAGLAGLSCAYELCKQGKEVTIIEKHPIVGGLARSFLRKGFHCDMGPHRFFTENDQILQHVLDVTDGEMLRVNRETRIFLMNRFFDYPLKINNVLVHMPTWRLFRIFFDYAAVRLRNLFTAPPDDSFEDWVVNRFGRELYRIFFQEYTEKTWGLPCSEISSDWAEQRISLLNLWDTIKNTIWHKEKAPRTFVSKFYYPRTGGIGFIAESYARKIKEMGGTLHLNSIIRNIHLEDMMISEVEYFHMDTGETISDCYDHVFSTISMKELINIMEPEIPEDVQHSAQSLLFNSVIFIYLLINSAGLSTNQWIYIPEKTLLNNRITEFKNFNKTDTPDDKTMICAEVTCRTNDDVWNMDDQDLVNQIETDLRVLELLGDNNVLDSHVVRMKEGYPIYDLHYRAKVTKIREFLGNIPNLSYFGRNAMFRYNNMDHSIDMGITMAQNIRSQQRMREIATEKRYFG